MAAALVPVGGCFKSVDSEETGLTVYIDTVCNAIFECECEGVQYASFESCQVEFANVLIQLQIEAQGEDLTFDAGCVDDRARAAEGNNCSGRSILGPAGVFESCLIYHGNKAEGEECLELDLSGGRMSDCEQGLVCRGRCVTPGNPDPAFLLTVGEPCADEFGRPIGECSDTLVCDAQGGKVCVMQAQMGDPCSLLPAYVCPDDAYCGQGGGGGSGGGSGGGGGGNRCVSRRDEGSGCFADYQCESLRCRDGECAEDLAAACQGDWIF